VTEQPFTFFTLVPQTDRRQLADRRHLCRGGRRACDIVTREQSIADAASTNPSSVLWSAAKHDLGSKVEKLLLH